MSSTWKLMWLIKQLDTDFAMDSFQERKWLQKIAVLAQEFGIPLGYDFGWYKHGPYSSLLADDAFTIETIPEVSWQQYIDVAEMGDHSNQIKQLTELVEYGKLELKSLSEANLLELLASLVFILKHTYPKPESKDDLFETLEKYKSFSREQMEIAWNILARSGLMNHQEN